MHIPRATYRLQFNPSFGFREAKEIIPYLTTLGISALYASPIFNARKGSTHGYDIVDPNQLNPELGDRKDFDELITSVKKYNLKWLQDIVPNHMAFDSENTLLMDVLEHGRKSDYFDFFDIDWDHPYEDIKDRVLAPFLGKVYAECLEAGEIQLQYHEGHLTINYFNLFFPVRVESYVYVFEHNVEDLEKKLSNDQPLFIKYLGALRYLKTVSFSEKATKYQIKHAKKILWNLYQESPIIEQFVNENLNFLNGEKGVQESFYFLDKLISEQAFRLAFWKVASEEINYRRFFAVNDLISLRVEDERVFLYNHGLIMQLVAEKKFEGLRVDHIDGLFNPFTYLKRLREKVGDIYIVIEKIFTNNEQLPASWPIQGTTGYDFLNFVNGVFCCQEKRSALTKIYENFTGLDIPCDDLLYEKKLMIIGKHFAGNIDNLAHFMKKISGRDRYGRDITLYGLRRALVEVMAMFPVYRSYISSESFTESDQAYIKTAICDAKKKSPGLFFELNFIEKFLLQKYDSSLTEEDKREWIQFAMYFQQHTGPLMAKAFEDTFFYVYNRLISLNEVGSNPIGFGCSIEEFHNFNQKRVEALPDSLNATSTHDTKRGEDIRARITVLSEIPQEWEENIKSWRKINRHKKRKLGRGYAPDENDEYFLYQTLLGVFPLNDYGEDFTPLEMPHAEAQGKLKNSYTFSHGVNAPGEILLTGFTTRMKSYIIKSVREAKVHTGWIKPDTEYEEACISFVKDILSPAEGKFFLKEFLLFQKKIAYYGMFNSLSQALIKLTSPGVPDFYQGTELWDLNLVDPDNRRPVDFEKRKKILQNIITKERQDISGLVKELLANKEDGRIKLFLIYRALRTRKENMMSFKKGAYLPLRTEGKFKSCVIAYLRVHEGTWIVTVAPRFLTKLIKEGEYPFGEEKWEDTRVILPENGPSSWKEEITGQSLRGEASGFNVGAVLALFPVALLVGKENNEVTRRLC